MRPTSFFYMVFLILASIQSVAESPRSKKKNVSEVQGRALIEEYRKNLEARDHGQYLPELCEILTSEQCLKVSHYLTPRHEKRAELNKSDEDLIKHLSDLESNKIIESIHVTDNVEKKQMIKMAALTLGSQAGYAAETRRNNRFFYERSQLLDKLMPLEKLLIKQNGRLIIPPIINLITDEQAVSKKGRVFRVASHAFMIKDDPKFVITPPRWQSYLMQLAPKPRIPDAKMLPKDALGKAIWINSIKKGYKTGVIQARKVAEYNIRKITNDILGMVRYHVLLTYGMVSEPKIDQRYYSTTGGGNSLLVNDKILTISVYPQLQNQTDAWRAIPRIPNFDFLNISNSDDFNSSRRVDPMRLNYE